MCDILPGKASVNPRPPFPLLLKHEHYHFGCMYCVPCEQVFHWSMFYHEYYKIWRRLGQLKALFVSILLWLLSFFFLTLRGPDRVGMHTMYGDGSAIPEKNVAHVRDVVWRNMKFNRWEKGDILMIDNFRVSHGRQVSSSLFLHLQAHMVKNSAYCLGVFRIFVRDVWKLLSIAYFIPCYLFSKTLYLYAVLSMLRSHHSPPSTLHREPS